MVLTVVTRKTHVFLKELVTGSWAGGDFERTEVRGGHPPRCSLGRMWSELSRTLAGEPTEPGGLPSITASSTIRRWDSLNECWRPIIKSESSTKNNIAVVSHGRLKVALMKGVCGHIGEEVERGERNPLTG